MLSDLVSRLFALTEPRPHHPWSGYLKSALIVGLITCAGFLFHLRQAPTNLAMLYLLGVVLSALRWGFGPALFIAIIGTVVFDYLFVTPYRSFAITDIWYFMTLAAMMSIGIVISVLASAAREQTLAAKEQAAQTSVLYSLTQSLNSARTADQVFRATAEQIQTHFGCAVVILLSEEDEEFVLRYQSPGRELDAQVRERARRFFQPVLKGPTIVGHNTFLPLRCGARVIGMMILLSESSPLQVSGASERVLDGVAGQVAMAIERAVFQDRAQETDLLRKANELHQTLLNSVSHSLRAPLAAILSALDPIGETGVVSSSACITELARIAQAEAYRLDWLIGNLLDLSRLEAGLLQPKRERHDVQNLIGSALGQLKKSQEREIETVVPFGLPDVFVDFALMVQVLVNLLHNALKYSPANLPVLIEARAIASAVEIRVSDSGHGIPATEREKIFQRFFRGARTDDVPGLGLGLPVAKGFVEAHNGSIWVEERPGGGSIFCFTMPFAGPIR